MSFVWAEYLNVAGHLMETSVNSDHEEAYLRSATSRAYYAALNTARSLLTDQWGIEMPQTAEIHSFIPRWFLSEEDEDQKEIGIILGRLRDRRRKADYDDAISKAASLAKGSLADAELLIQRLSRL